VSAAEVLELADATLAAAGLDAGCVRAIATVEARRDEPGIAAAAAGRGWALVAHPADVLTRVPVPAPSALAAAAVGTPSVAEAAALLGDQPVRPAAPGGGAGVIPGVLVAGKRRSAHATVAVARHPRPAVP